MLEIYSDCICEKKVVTRTIWKKFKEMTETGGIGFL